MVPEAPVASAALGGEILLPSPALSAGAGPRPAALGAERASSARQGGPEITVIGILTGRSRLAIVAWRGQAYVVAAGDRIGDVTVVAVGANEVVVRQGRQVRALAVSVSDAGPAATPVPSPGGETASAPAAASAAPLAAAAAPTQPASSSATVPEAPPAPASGGAGPTPTVATPSFALPAYAPLSPIGLPATTETRIPVLQWSSATDVPSQSPAAVTPLIPPAVTTFAPTAAPASRSSTPNLAVSLAPTLVAPSAFTTSAPRLPSGATAYTPLGPGAGTTAPPTPP